MGPYSTINLGTTPNDGTGDNLRAAMAKLNANFAEIEERWPSAADSAVDLTGASNATTEFQAALTAAAGGALWLPQGSTIRLDGSVAVPANTMVWAYGSTFDLTHRSGAFSGITLAAGSQWHGGTLTGPSDTYVAGQNGIVAYGTRNGAAVAPTYIDNITVHDVTVTDFGGIGIAVGFARHVKVVSCVITDCGYGGVDGTSVSDMWADDCRIERINGDPGTSDAYGIVFTSLVGTSDFVRDPRSNNSGARHNVVRDIPLWHGLDTHGGDRITFANNLVLDCKVGCAITHLTTAGASHCVVRDNTFVNTLTGTNPSDGTEKQGEAIWDVGASTSVRNSYTVIDGNITYQHGKVGTNTGAILIFNANDGRVINNTINEPYTAGIMFSSNVARYRCKANDIVDPKGPGIAGGGVTDNPTCINFDGSLWEVDVIGNTLTRANTGVATEVGKIGIAVASTSSKDLMFFGNVFNGVPTEWSIGGANYVGIVGEVTGTFSATITGLTTTPTVAVLAKRAGSVVTLSIAAGTGTSNSTACTLTGMPETWRPSAAQTVYGRTIDNNVIGAGVIVAETSGTLTLHKDAALGAFTNSGIKGVSANTIVYQV